VFTAVIVSAGDVIREIQLVEGPLVKRSVRTSSAGSEKDTCLDDRGGRGSEFCLDS
jgi:hypothetical protein